MDHMAECARVGVVWGPFVPLTPAKLPTVKLYGFPPPVLQDPTQILTQNAFTELMAKIFWGKKHQSYWDSKTRSKMTIRHHLLLSIKLAGEKLVKNIRRACLSSGYILKCSFTV